MNCEEKQCDFINCIFVGWGYIQKARGNVNVHCKDIYYETDQYSDGNSLDSRDRDRLIQCDQIAHIFIVVTAPEIQKNYVILCAGGLRIYIRYPFGG